MSRGKDFHSLTTAVWRTKPHFICLLPSLPVCIGRGSEQRPSNPFVLGCICIWDAYRSLRENCSEVSLVNKYVTWQDTQDRLWSSHENLIRSLATARDCPSETLPLPLGIAFTINTTWTVFVGLGTVCSERQQFFFQSLRVIILHPFKMLISNTGTSTEEELKGYVSQLRKCF